LANIKSALKRARQAEKRRTTNTNLRSTTMTYLKRARNAVAECQTNQDKPPSKETLETAKQACQKAMTYIDRMVPKKIFHKNKAARLKSNLSNTFKKVSAASK